MKAHIHGFCAFRLNAIVYYAVGRGVVCLNGSWGLFVAHLVQYISFLDCFARINVYPPVSASAAEDITALIILATLWMAPLFGGMGTSSERK